MNNFNRVAAACAAVAVALTLAAQPAPAQAQQVKDTIGGSDVTTITAKIEAVDQANRTVTVKGPMGRVVTLKVDPKVKNFAQVKAGDEMVLKYSEAVSIKLEKGSAGRSETVTTTPPMSTAPAGAKPSGAMGQQTVIVANVQSVDAKSQEVLLQGPKGNYVEVKVKDPEVFKSIKVGDSVTITYTEALVIDVVTPTKK